MKKQAVRLSTVSPEPNRVLAVTDTDGRVVRVSLSDMAKRLQVFAPLENTHEFASAKIADFGWSLEWDCGASLDSDRLIELALEQAGMSENVFFRRWQDTHNLSLTDAAHAIGLTRRTVSQYPAPVRAQCHTSWVWHAKAGKLSKATLPNT